MEAKTVAEWISENGKPYSLDEFRLSYYADYDYAPGDGRDLDWTDISRTTSGRGVVYTVRYASGFDAFGRDLVSESNYDYLTTNYPDTFRVLHFHNVDQLCVLETDILPADAWDDLEALDRYPLLDEDDYSRREFEHFWECWDSYGRRDFRDALGEQFSDDEWLFELADEQLDDLYLCVRESLMSEYGDEPTFDEVSAAEIVASLIQGDTLENGSK